MAGGVRGDHRDQPVLVDLRAGVRRALRARLPPHPVGRGHRHPQSQAHGHGPARQGLQTRGPAGHATTDHRHCRRGACRPHRRARSRGRGLRRPHLRDVGPARRHDDLGHPRLPLPGKRDPGGHGPAVPAKCPGDRIASELRVRQGRHARGAEGAPRRGAAYHRRLVGQGDEDRGRGRRPGGRRRLLPAPDQCRRAAGTSRNRGCGRRRRRLDGCLPGGPAHARLREGQGGLPARPRGDPRPHGRARRRDQGRHRVHLFHHSRFRSRPKATVWR